MLRIQTTDLNFIPEVGHELSLDTDAHSGVDHTSSIVTLMQRVSVFLIVKAFEHISDEGIYVCVLCYLGNL